MLRSRSCLNARAPRATEVAYTACLRNGPAVSGQPFGRFEADVGQRVVCASIGVERFGGSAAAAQRTDQDFPGEFVERKLGQQRLGLGDGGGEFARFQQHVGELFSCTDPELFRDAGLRADGVEVGQLSESVPVPQFEDGP
jgi:hypothetical protein